MPNSESSAIIVISFTELRPKRSGYVPGSFSKQMELAKGINVTVKKSVKLRSRPVLYI